MKDRKSAANIITILVIASIITLAGFFVGIFLIKKGDSPPPILSKPTSASSASEMPVKNYRISSSTIPAIGKSVVGNAYKEEAIGETIAGKSCPPKHKEVILPTLEERREMESKGIFCY
jgi:hypothetical protein